MMMQVGLKAKRKLQLDCIPNVVRLQDKGELW